MLTVILGFITVFFFQMTSNGLDSLSDISSGMFIWQFKWLTGANMTSSAVLYLKNPIISLDYAQLRFLAQINNTKCDFWKLL